MNPSDFVKTCLTFVPARGGSTRVKDKNIRLLAGRPLLEYTLEAALRSKYGLIPTVSTNDQAIGAIAEKAGAEVSYRPDELASATASTESAILHLLDHRKKEGVDYEHVLLLPPTSPFRKSQTIDAFIEAYCAGVDEMDCLMSVTENRGDFWTVSDSGWKRLFPDAPRRQQDREPLYEENSAIYLFSVRALRETGIVLGARTQCKVIDAVEAWDINHEHDLKIAEVLSESLKEGK